MMMLRLQSSLKPFSLIVSILLSTKPVASFSTRHSKNTISLSTGQRCLHIPCRRHGNPPTAPPLLLVIGTAQTLQMWEPTGNSLAADRDVLIYEPRGVGPSSDNDNNDSSLDVSLAAQASYLQRTLDTVFGPDTVMDAAGFSLGGRILMATAAVTNSKHRFRKMHLTGVARQRSRNGLVRLEEWRSHLRHNGNLRAFAWSALTASYAPDFLYTNLQRLESWVDAMCQSQTVHGVRALLEQAHDEDGEWSVQCMAERIRESNTIPVGRLLVGEVDQLAPPEYVHELGKVLDWPVQVVPGCGHAVTVENPRVWKQDVQAFLKNDV